MSDLEFQTGWERYRIPALLAGGLAIYGASRFDATRAVAGLLLTYGFPLIAVIAAVAPFRDSSSFGLAATVGAVAALASELAIGHAIAPSVPLFAAASGSAPVVVTLAAALAGVGVQAAGAARGVRNFYAAWMGMLTMLVLYLPSHTKAGKDSLDAFVAALLVSLFVGGGAGMLLGGLATRFVKKPSSP